MTSFTCEVSITFHVLDLKHLNIISLDDREKYLGSSLDTQMVLILILADFPNVTLSSSDGSGSSSSLSGGP